jgi:tellurite methyltransferase
MSINWQEHYTQTKSRPPGRFLVEALTFVERKGTAVDLGSGDLQDVQFLLTQGFNKVIAIDKELPPQELLDALPKDNFHFIHSPFDQFAFPVKEYDLVNAHYSLPFNSPTTFNKVWDSVEHSLATNGIFTGQFFGTHDQWNDGTQDITFHTQTEVEELFTHMEVLAFEEEEKDRILSNGEKKHWHLFHVIAKA